MILSPGFLIGLALICGFGIVPILILLSHGLLRIESAKSRFIYAVLFCLLIWFIGLILWVVKFDLNPPVNFYAELFAGAAILLTGIIAWGILWSIVCWGFTASLALALARVDQPATFEMWLDAYGGGSNIEDFTADRLSVLFSLDLAKKNEDLIFISGKAGHYIALIVVILRWFYGIKDPNHKGIIHE